MFFLATVPLFHFPLLQWPLDFWGNICKYTLTSCLFMALSAMFFSWQGAQIHQQELRSHSKHTSDFNQRIKEEWKLKNILTILKILWLNEVYIIKYAVLFSSDMVWSLAVFFYPTWGFKLCSVSQDMNSLNSVEFIIIKSNCLHCFISQFPPWGHHLRASVEVCWTICHLHTWLSPDGG